MKIQKHPEKCSTISEFPLILCTTSVLLTVCFANRPYFQSNRTFYETFAFCVCPHQPHLYRIEHFTFKNVEATGKYFKFRG